MTIVIALQCDTSPWELSEALRGNFLIGRSVQQCHTWKYEMLSVVGIYSYLVGVCVCLLLRSWQLGKVH